MIGLFVGVTYAKDISILLEDDQDEIPIITNTDNTIQEVVAPTDNTVVNTPSSTTVDQAPTQVVTPPVKKLPKFKPSEEDEEEERELDD